MWGHGIGENGGSDGAVERLKQEPRSSPTVEKLGYAAIVFAIRGIIIKMKMRDRGILPLALAMILATAGVVRSQTLQISPGFKEPLTVSGTSGGPNNSGDCGNIAPTPNLIIQVGEDLPYWRISVQTAGAPTMLIQGPAGRFCVLPESAAAGNLEFSGFGNKGTYSIFVGDRAQGQHPYNLSITQNRN